jgi:hypothetical protein
MRLLLEMEGRPDARPEVLVSGHGNHFNDGHAAGRPSTRGVNQALTFVH